MIPAELLFEEENTEPTMVVISIAVSEYRRGFDDLPNALRDAELIIEALENKYEVGSIFKLHDADFTVNKVKETFTNLRGSLREKDSILVLYNGHGTLDNNNLLYWIPKYGFENQPDTWYLASHIFEEIRSLNTENSAIIVNCCESGRMPGQEMNPNKELRSNISGTSRMILTSGSIFQDVYDSFENSSNSPFARALVKCLKDNNEQRISFLSLSDFVISQFYDDQLKQRPVFGHWEGHQEGMFYFFLKRNEDQCWIDSKTLDSIESYRSYLTSFGKGKYSEVANTRYEELIKERDAWIETLKYIQIKLIDFNNDFQCRNGKFFDEFDSLNQSVDKEIRKLTYEQEIEERWTKIQNSVDIQDFVKFEIDFPENNKYLGRSKEIQRKLKHGLDAEEKWKIAVKKQVNPNEYRKKLIVYLKDFPMSDHSYEANLIIIDIEEYIDAKSTGNLVKLEKYARKEKAVYKTEALEFLTTEKKRKHFQELKEELDSAIQVKEVHKIFYIKDEIHLFETSKQPKEIKHLYECLSEQIKSFEQVMQEDFDQAIKEQSLLGLYNFIDDFKEGDLVEKALVAFKNLEEEGYNTAVLLDTIEDFEYFISEFKPFKDNKKIILDFYNIAIQRVQDLNQDKKMYEQADNNTADLEDYIEKCKSGLLLGKYEVQAQEKLESLKLDLERKMMYEQILLESTTELCERFVSRYPDIKDEIYRKVTDIFAKLKSDEKRSIRYRAIINETDITAQLKMAKAFISRYTGEADIELTKKVEEIIFNALNEQKDAETFNYAKETEKLEDRIEALNKIAQNDNSIFKNEANQIVEGLLKKIRIDQAEFDQAIAAENLEEKIRLISLYLSREGCIKKEEAQFMLNALIIEKQDIALFEEIKAHDDSVEAWERFITASVQSERRDYAVNRKNQLLEEKEEENSYQYLIASQSKTACYTYINKYGSNGKFIAEVEQTLNQILNNEALIKGSGVEKIEKTIDENLKHVSKRINSVQIIFFAVLIFIVLFVILYLAKEN